MTSVPLNTEVRSKPVDDNKDLRRFELDDASKLLTLTNSRMTSLSLLLNDEQTMASLPRAPAWLMHVIGFALVSTKVPSEFNWAMLLVNAGVIVMGPKMFCSTVTLFS